MNSLRVATLNIWNRMGPWTQRQPLITKELQSLNPDLIGMQEVLELRTGDMAMNQASEFGDSYHLAYAAGHELGQSDEQALNFGNALLSRFPITHHERYALPGGDISDQHRSMLHAIVDAPLGPLHVFVTHLNWKLDEGFIRVQQVKRIVSIIEDVAPREKEQFPAILMGDFNAEPDSDEMRFLRGLACLDGRSTYFADAWLYSDGGPGYTFDRTNPYANELNEHPRRIDYIFIRDPLFHGRGNPRRTELAFHRPTDGVWPSDHFGVVTDLATEPAAQ